jgi:hypothetical protein
MLIALCLRLPAGSEMTDSITAITFACLCLHLLKLYSMQAVALGKEEIR